MQCLADVGLGKAVYFLHGHLLRTTLTNTSSSDDDSIHDVQEHTPVEEGPGQRLLHGHSTDREQRELSRRHLRVEGKDREAEEIQRSGEYAGCHAD